MNCIFESGLCPASYENELNLVKVHTWCKYNEEPRVKAACSPTCGAVLAS